MMTGLICITHFLFFLGLAADPYVKVWLMHKDKRVEKKKTVTIKRCLNPIFNESFPFDVPAHVLRETTIIITVMDKDRLSRNDVIGKVRTHFLCPKIVGVTKS